MFGDGFPFGEFCINEHVYRLRANGLSSQSFLYFWLTSELVMDEMRIKGTGVAIPGLNSTAVRSLTTMVPGATITRAFTETVEPCIARVLRNSSESQSLAALRDALLPKLLSGQIRAPDAERVVGRHVQA
jgi:type I restriction enzyme S subunit